MISVMELSDVRFWLRADVWPLSDLRLLCLRKQTNFSDGLTSAFDPKRTLPTDKVRLAVYTVIFD